MTPNVPTKTEEDTAPKKVRLAELLARTLEDDAVEVDDPADRERWDEDEGSFGG